MCGIFWMLARKDRKKMFLFSDSQGIFPHFIWRQNNPKSSFKLHSVRKKDPIQNHHWKLGQQAPSVGTIYLGLFRDYDLDHIFSGLKLSLFSKIESWNFQYLFEKEFCETSQNFNSIRQLIEKVKIKIVWMSLNFVRFHEIHFQTDAESFSFLSWKTKKFYS